MLIAVLIALAALLTAFGLYVSLRQLIRMDRRWRAYRKLEKRIRAISAIVIRYEMLHYDTDPYSGSIADYHNTLVKHRQSIRAWTETPVPVERISDLVPAGITAAQWETAAHLDRDALSVLAQLQQPAKTEYDLSPESAEHYFELVHTRVSSELTHSALMSSGLVPAHLANRSLDYETLLDSPL